MKRTPKKYRRLDKADRVAIENGLDRRKPRRQIAYELGRSPPTIAYEVARNRTVGRGPDKGERVSGEPDGACPKFHLPMDIEGVCGHEQPWSTA